LKAIINDPIKKMALSEAGLQPRMLAFPQNAEKIEKLPLQSATYRIDFLSIKVLHDTY